MPQNDVYTEPSARPAGVPLRVYSNPICPFAQRVRLIVAAKNIPAEEINIHLKVKPEWFLEKINPYGKVPVVEHDGKVIRESLIAFDFVDEVFGGKSLWPDNAYHKALGKLLVNDFGNEFIPNFYKFYGGKDDEKSNGELVKFLQRLEDILKAHKGGFLGGETAGAVDYILWPWIERLGALKVLKPEITSIFSEDKFPTFYVWITKMKQTDAVKKTILSDEAHVAFIKGVQESGKHDYSHADVTGEGVTIYTKKQD